MTSVPQDFQLIYKNLNHNQKLAVDTIEGPVMVIAGPGTGKTMVLTARIANILDKTDVKPHNILALTFTESAAATMRRRLVELIGSAGYYVRIETFHAFCTQVIQENPEYFAIQRSGAPLSDLEKYSFLEEIITQLKLEALKPIGQPFLYVKECIKQISQLKREGFSPEDFEKLVSEELKQFVEDEPDLKKTELEKRQKNLNKQQELLQIYQHYQSKLTAEARYDFDDMIIFVMVAFEKNEILLRTYQEEIHYFLVDEYQDTNAAQNKVVDLLASYWQDQANLFVVGDPHQSIYRFQGASMENMLSFIDRYPKSTIINLEIGYRCSQLIYNAAQGLIINNVLTNSNALLAPALNQILQSANPGKEDPIIKVHQAPSLLVELIEVASQIKELTNAGVEPEEIAVLYRHNKDVFEVQRVFEHFGIKYEIDGGGNVLESNQIKQLLTLLSVIEELKSGEDSGELFEVLCFEWTATNSLLAIKLARAASKARVSLTEMILSGYENFSKLHIGAEVSEKEFNQTLEFVEQIFAWGVFDQQMLFPKWFELVLEQSGYLDWIVQSEVKIGHLSEINALYGLVKSMTYGHDKFGLQKFLQAINLMREYKLWLESEDLNIKAKAVQLATTHKAKGREWRYVFLIHCLDKKWGNNKERNLLSLPDTVLQHTSIDKKEKNEDERRLFYVALTRAKDQVHISYPATVPSGSKSKDSVPSMFISEISEFTENDVASESVRTVIDPVEHLSVLLRPPVDKNFPDYDREYLLSLVNKFSLSATSLNKYLRDPHDFFLNSLLKVPRAKAEHMAFGTAIHQALEFLFSRIIETSEKPPLQDVLHSYKVSLNKEMLISYDFERRLEYGYLVLENYWQQLDANLSKPLFLEKQFGFGKSKTMLGDILLTGRIDRIDLIDADQKLVRVVDYKTGKSKSDNEIKGKTESAGLSEREQALPETIRGAYQRQLVFYKLLSELDVNFTHKVTEAVFEFVEPDKKSGKTIYRNLVISDQAVADLRKLIIEVMSEIRSLKFLEFPELLQSD